MYQLIQPGTRVRPLHVHLDKTWKFLDPASGEPSHPFKLSMHAKFCAQCEQISSRGGNLLSGLLVKSVLQAVCTFLYFSARWNVKKLWNFEDPADPGSS